MSENTEEQPSNVRTTPSRTVSETEASTPLPIKKKLMVLDNESCEYDAVTKVFFI